MSACQEMLSRTGQIVANLGEVVLIDDDPANILMGLRHGVKVGYATRRSPRLLLCFLLFKTYVLILFEQGVQFLVDVSGEEASQDLLSRLADAGGFSQNDAVSSHS